jgi:lipoprotein-releasing system ATP-binding protein
MSEPPILSIRGLERIYVTGDGKLPVLKGVDLDVRPGEVVGLIGPSGSGKSSLLHAAGLLEHPDAGRIVVGGVDCSELSERERTRVRLAELGFVYQFHHLLPEFTALDNVALPIRIAGASQAEARARAEELGGEQQRVAIARALANRPRLLLADEPTGNLDPATSKTVFAALHDLVRHHGVAALVATHNMELTREMERVFALKEGRLQPLEQPRAPAEAAV